MFIFNPDDNADRSGEESGKRHHASGKSRGGRVTKLRRQDVAVTACLPVVTLI
ncbi:hypothetical protein [Serratia rubidaea]|uniref:hypothetical protein n=1 Tax=Serratia rubidaea TaxID=61652 RepID=UPI00130DDFCF|nr:hypothetical protein [Serratia rubidaea]